MSKRKNKKRFNTKRFFKLFVVYFLVFLASLSLIDYYAYMAYSPKIIVSFSIVAGLISAYIHIKKGKRDHVDEIADELL